MANITFKVGDRVKIIDCSCIEPYELNKIGIIVKIRSYYEGAVSTYIVDMGRPRRPGSGEDTETCWWLRAGHIELVAKPNEQLEFAFMQTSG